MPSAMLDTMSEYPSFPGKISRCSFATVKLDPETASLNCSHFTKEPQNVFDGVSALEDIEAKNLLNSLGLVLLQFEHLVVNCPFGDDFDKFDLAFLANSEKATVSLITVSW